MMLALKLPNWLINDSVAVLELLQDYDSWYMMLITCAICAGALVLAGNMLMIRSLIRSNDMGSANIIMALITLSLAGLSTFAMIIDEEVTELHTAIQQDMKAMEYGGMLTAITYVNDHTLPFAAMGMPGPYDEGQPKPFTALKVRDPAYTWMTLRLPRTIDAKIIPKDGYFNDKIGAVAFQPRLQFIRVTYTPNFRIVTRLELTDRPQAGNTYLE